MELQPRNSAALSLAALSPVAVPATLGSSGCWELKDEVMALAGVVKALAASEITEVVGHTLVPEACNPHSHSEGVVDHENYKTQGKNRVMESFQAFEVAVLLPVLMDNTVHTHFRTVHVADPWHRSAAHDEMRRNPGLVHRGFQNYDGSLDTVGQSYHTLMDTVE